MPTLFLSDGQVAQTTQDGSTFVLMCGFSTVISAGADMIFASSTGHSTIIAAGVQATGAGYLGDTVVLSDTGTADVLLGAGDLVYGGAAPLPALTCATAPAALSTSTPPVRCPDARLPELLRQRQTDLPAPGGRVRQRARGHRRARGHPARPAHRPRRPELGRTSATRAYILCFYRDSLDALDPRRRVSGASAPLAANPAAGAAA